MVLIPWSSLTEMLLSGGQTRTKLSPAVYMFATGPCHSTHFQRANHSYSHTSQEGDREIGNIYDSRAEHTQVFVVSHKRESQSQFIPVSQRTQVSFLPLLLPPSPLPPLLCLHPPKWERLYVNVISITKVFLEKHRLLKIYKKEQLKKSEWSCIWFIKNYSPTI